MPHRTLTSRIANQLTEIDGLCLENSSERRKAACWIANAILTGKFQPPATETTMQGQKPVDRIREGRVKFSIWPQEGPSGTFHNAKLEFQYRDKKDGTWRDGSSYSISDLENLEKAARQARERMQALNKTNKPAREPGLEG
jgi:hypothetical protein